MILILFLIPQPGYLPAETDTEAEWELVRELNNIQVYTRKSEESKFKEVKIKAYVEAEMNELIAAIEDVPNHKKWVSNTIQSKFLEKFSDDHFIYYLSTDLPFPVKDRDLIVEYRRTVDLENKVVYTESHSRPGFIETEDDFTHVAEFYSKYVIKPEGNGIRLEYYMKIDPGGILPAWLVNLAIARGPLETMNALFSLLKSGAYKDAEIPALEKFNN